MSSECFPMTALPHTSRLFADYLAMAQAPGDAAVHSWYGTGYREAAVADAERLADALKAQSVEFGAGAAALANIEKLRYGARAVVTGQQVGLFGGPLLTLLKAATAVARAKQATDQTGVEHVPMFWLATEDHDLEEVDQVSLLTKHTVETLRAGLKTSAEVEVGGVVLGPEVEAILEQASEMLEWGPVCDLLRECYVSRDGYTATLGGAFARWMCKLFEVQGLVIVDAAGREFHAMGAKALRHAIEHAPELEAALLERTKELEAAGYHAQVLVVPGHSLLFLVDDETGGRAALRRVGEGWKAAGKSYSTEELLSILEDAPERISPNALLRPVFQDCLLPTAAYIGGPAEVAYFAQSEVVYGAVLGEVTPVLARFSATLMEPAIANVMDQHELRVPGVFTTVEELAQRLGARAMPIEGKRKLAAVGNAMDKELTAFEEYLSSMDASLGRSAKVSGSKMRYQMNRLRRMAATFELQKEGSLKKHAEVLVLHLFPDGHPQERVVAGAWFVARYGDGLVERLVAEASAWCGGHVVVRL
jgi:bacillithiol biosynthesis cysteine-adding enzyme BshC